MLDADTVIHEALKRRLGERSLQISVKGTDVNVRTFREMDAADVRRKAKALGMHLLHGDGYVAVSQWDIVHDEIHYYVVRE